MVDVFKSTKQVVLFKREMRRHGTAPYWTLDRAALEQFVPILYLRVSWILNLQPRRGTAVRLIRPAGPLRVRKVIQVQQPRFDPRHDARQLALACQQRQPAEITFVK